MKTRHIILFIFSWFALSIQAQNVELEGLLVPDESSLSGRMVIARLDEIDAPQSVQLVCYSLRDGKTTLSDEAVVLADGYYLLPLPQLDRNFVVPMLETTDRYTYQVKVITSDGRTLVTEMIEDNGVERFRWIGSDVRWTSYTTGYAPDTPRIDGSIDYSTNPFAVGGISFYKSFSTHAKGSFTFNLPQDNPYSRFFTYYGIQDNKTQGDVRFSLIVNDEVVESHDIYSMTNTTKPADYDGIYLRKFEAAIDGKTDIVLDGGVIDNYNHDHMNFLMGRLYLKKDSRKEQSTTWLATQVISSDRPTSHTLDAVFTSGNPVYYLLTSGNDYADIQGITLNLHTLPQAKDEYIEVLAVQPGNDEYNPAMAKCRFYVRNNKTVRSDEKLVLKDGDVIDQLTVYAGPDAAGQVVVEGGAAHVARLVLCYTFVPGQWNFISFPANVDIDRISNLDSLGYRFNGDMKAYYICEYATHLRAENLGKSAWQKLPAPDVVKNRGYIMGVSRSADNPGDAPVEVVFTFENTTLGLDAAGNGSMNVELNLMQMEPGTELPVYVSPDGIEGAPLRVMVRFEPADLSVLPVNYARALDEARVTFNPNRSGIRLTLPTQDEARVVIFDRKQRIVKAVKYKSPHLIDIHDLVPGEYSLYIQYGNADDVKSFTVGQ